MALVLATLLERVRVLGKDTNTQYTTERTNFIKDIVREITTTFDWHWLYKINDITTTSTWQNLPTDFHKSKGIKDAAGKRVRFLSEEEYFIKAEEITNNKLGYYRLKWDDTNARWQIKFENVAASVALNQLYKWWTSDVTKMPDFLEEAIVVGATAKFMAMLEGDDAEQAQRYRNDFVFLIQQHKFLGDNDAGDGPKRMKTNFEIETDDSIQRYNDQG